MCGGGRLSSWPCPRGVGGGSVGIVARRSGLGGGAGGGHCNRCLLSDRPAGRGSF